MTRDEVEQISAGREMDALVAEKVMGWKLVPYTAYCGGTPEQATATAIAHGWYIWENGSGDEIPGQMEDNQFSTDIAAAWQVVDKIREQQGNVFTLWSGARTGPFSWRCQVLVDVCLYDASGETAPMAICRAALLVVKDPA